MPAKDISRDVIRKGLECQEWVITHDPLLLVDADEYNRSINLGAKQLIAAERDQCKIAVEVNSFSGSSLPAEFHVALGKFVHYRYALTEQEADRILYLAVPIDVYEKLLLRNFYQKVLRNHQVKLIVYSVKHKEIVEWIEWKNTDN